MSTVTDNDLKELKDLINNRFEQLDQNMIELKLEQRELKARLDSMTPAMNKIFDLSEKVGELKNWRQFVFTVIAVVASGAIGWFIRNNQL